MERSDSRLSRATCWDARAVSRSRCARARAARSESASAAARAWCSAAVSDRSDVDLTAGHRKSRARARAWPRNPDVGGGSEGLRGPFKSCFGALLAEELLDLGDEIGRRRQLVL